MAVQDGAARLQAILESTEDTPESLKELRDSIANASDTLSALRLIQAELNTLKVSKSADETSRKQSKLVGMLMAVPLMAAAEKTDAKQASAKGGGGGGADAHVNGSERGEADERKQRKLFTSCWRTVLGQPLSERLLRRVLAQADRVLAVQFDAVQFCDLLAHAFDRGGHVAALALGGIVTLMTRHNLDYPHFYTRLYTLLRNEVAKLADAVSETLVDSVWDGRHRRRFVRLLGMCLSSAHLPAYLVAAFVKLAVRGALFATDALCAADLLVLAYNVLLAHAECHFLLHNRSDRRPTSDADEANVNEANVNDDPFDWTVNDPAKARALDTSLWEARSLERHYDATVRRIAVRFRKSLANRGELPYASASGTLAVGTSGPEAKRPRKVGIDSDGLDLSVRYNVERDKVACTFSDSRLFTDCFAL